VLNNNEKDDNGDPQVSVDRRVLAGATVGIGLDVAYLAITELQEALTALASDVRNTTGHGEGYKDIEEILTDKNPYQMRLWYLLYDTPIEQAITELAWLQSVTYRRGRMCNVMRRSWTTWQTQADEQRPVRRPGRESAPGDVAGTGRHERAEWDCRCGPRTGRPRYSHEAEWRRRRRSRTTRASCDGQRV
jgi:hypothetical protein